MNITKIAINVGLIGLIGFLCYLLYQSIEEPVKFKEAYTSRKDAVEQRLKDIARAQEGFKAIKKTFAKDFDELEDVLTNDYFIISKTIGDPDDPNSNSYIDTILVPARDSVQRMLKFNKLEELRYVPIPDLAEGTELPQFEMMVDSAMQQGVMVDFFLAQVRVGTFMGEEFDNPYYSRYDASYDPDGFVVETSKR